MPTSLVKERIAVATALDYLCKDSAYDEVPVAAICEEAGISRASFYRYFENKYAVAVWFEDLLLDAGMLQIGRSYNWHDGFLISSMATQIFPYMMQEAVLCEGYQTLVGNTERRFSAALLDTCENVKHVKVDDNLRYQIRFFTSAAARESMLNRRRGSMTPVDIADDVVSCVPRRLFDLLDKPEWPKPFHPVSLSDLTRMPEGDVPPTVLGESSS